MAKSLSKCGLELIHVDNASDSALMHAGIVLTNASVMVDCRVDIHRAPPVSAWMAISHPSLKSKAFVYPCDNNIEPHVTSRS